MNVRERFENDVVKILMKISANLPHLSYLSLGCGGLFPDLLVLRQAILAGKSIDVILIDSIFEGFIDNFRSVDESSPGKSSDLPAVELRWIGEYNNSDIRKNCFPRYSTADMVANFVGWLNWRSKRKSRVFVFGSLGAYLKFSGRTGQLTPDLAIGCDLPAGVLVQAQQIIPRLLCLHCRPNVAAPIAP